MNIRKVYFKGITDNDGVVKRHDIFIQTDAGICKNIKF